MIRALLILFFIFLFPNGALGQDSLSNKTFKELDKLSVDSFEAGNIELSRIYSKYQIARAKEEKDSVRIAYAFHTYMHGKDVELALKYCDSAIHYTHNSNHKFHPTYGYLVKSRRLIESRRFDEAMENLVVAYDYAVQKNNLFHISDAKQKMGTVKSFLGNYEEALKLFQEDYYHVLKNDHTTYRKFNLEVSTYNFTLIFIKNKMLDSARHYANLGLKSSDYRSHRYYKFVAANATIDYYSGMYDSAFDSLMKYKEKYKGNSLANRYYYIGKIYDHRGDRESANKYFSSVDSIVIADHEPFMEVKDVYQTMAEYYKDKNNDSLQIVYINKYIWADSILNHQKAQISPLMELKFDNPRMLAEKQRLIDKAESKNKWLYIISALALLFVIVGAGLYFYQVKLKRKLEVLLKEGVNSKALRNIARSNVELIVPQNIVLEIQKKLEEFENSDLVKNSSLNQGILASEMETNTRYLSNYINFFKGKNFPSYLKELRIRIGVERLKKEPELLKYSIRGLASEFGFVTASAFSRAFVKHTGIKPSQFLNELSKK